MSASAKTNGRDLHFVSDQVPLYYQLQTILTEKIQSGNLEAGQQLPTEAELGSQYGVSRITVRQALSKLEAENLIRREAGRGTFVNERRPFTSTLQLEGSLEDLMSIVRMTSVRVLRISQITASAEEARLLQVPTGASLVRCTRVRSYRNEPFCLVVNDLPREIGQQLARSDWKGSVTQVLQEKLHIPLMEARQSIRASLADTEAARVLAVRVGAPLLSVDRVVYTDDGTPVDRVQTHYRSDIFSFTVHLRRDHPEASWAFDGRRKEPQRSLAKKRNGGS
jgi:GntR family transcriptional regulator